MKKITFAFALCLTAIIFFASSGRQATLPENCGKIYYTDRLLHRLIPVDFPVSENKQRSAEKMMSAIIRGKDENTQILRIIPDIKDAASVRVKGDTAYVNLSKKVFENIPKTPEHEKLLVYQIVNSLTTINGINHVSFSLDGKISKDFLGFLDMREIFTPDYDI